ncbi:MAG: hypothetical protein V4691_01880 [Pseudomonadota bacterium]
MTSNEDLDKAVRDGIISAEQAEKLRGLNAAKLNPAEPAPSPDEERFRILGGFNDIFVTIGLFLLIGALYSFSSVFQSYLGFAALSAAMAWILSEVFARKLRLALPSIILSQMFAFSICVALISYFYNDYDSWLSNLFENGSGGKIIILISLVSAAAAALHLWRFRVPIDGSIIAFFLIGAFLGLLALVFGGRFITDHYNGIFFIGGLATFIAAMWLDISDRLRVTRRADMAFWLHLLAAPMLIHPVVALAFGGELRYTEFSATQAVIMLIGFAVLSLFALVIDRRAILVSALIYAGFAIFYLIDKTASADLTPPITLIVLAAVVLSLSAGWRVLRNKTVNGLPIGNLRNYIPPTN